MSPGTGVLLNDTMFHFDPEPGGRSSVIPGMRPLVPVAPVLVLKDGKPLLCAGAPGDVKIITALVQVIVNVIDHEMSAQPAISAPRIHCDGVQTFVNERLGEDVVEGLRRLGQSVVVKEDSFSALSFAFPAAIVDHGELMSGGVDPLKPSRALGV
jgi:gamma-glutamyltranspeptidase/glutathione hydrolase